MLPPTAPATSVIGRLAALEGRPLLEVTAPYPLLALAIDVGGEVSVAIANTGPEALELILPDGTTTYIDGFAGVWQGLVPTVGRPYGDLPVPEETP